MQGDGSPSRFSEHTPIVSRSGSGKLIIANSNFFNKNDDIADYQDP